ncbi:CYFA0S07e00694g1_1 [Cyberlindnera fabianii]|uniref:CYFA0S07e00694g1_1 n=1 Tax=Cyberlindnera fabianii TaxID=36022 RepID=A0A061AUK4_CYBFA|nr:CYFA0S07e00694g1_1 [Cyberlindnera fabianii]
MADDFTEAESPLNRGQRKKKTKTFTGCATCRSRKIKCDLGRPWCKRCEKSGLVCQGYQIQLCWSKPIQFDKYGYQLRSADGEDEDDMQKGFQRRNIDFVRYDREYETYDEMDRDLGLLHSPDYDLIEHSQTWMQGPFGVFEGLREIPSDVLRKRRKISKKKFARQMAESEDNSRSNSRRVPETAQEHVPLSDTAITTPTNTLNNVSNAKQSPAQAPTHPPAPTSNNHEIGWQPGNLFEDQLKINHEWLSNELRFDALLSATAASTTSKDHNILFSDFLYPFQSSLTQPNAETPPPNTTTTNNSVGTTFAISSILGNINDAFPYDRDLFNAVRPQHPPAPPAIARQPSADSIHDKDAIIIETSESRMPESVIKIIDTPIVPTLTPSLNIPTTGLCIGSLTRFLLNHYFEHVADIMTVVVFRQNPWKTIYFPRAVRALGDLAAQGRSSNSRMSLLNALMAVSCFNLQSKFEKGSTEMKFFLNLGIEFRMQASSFLKKMIQGGTNPSEMRGEKYKDVVTAILSMNTIDVVWGTMADCQYHLSLCGEIISKRMKDRPELSNKAKSLHRIFSFLKLLQDSTNFSNLSQITTEEKMKFIGILSESNDRRRDNGEFKENIDMNDGLIGIEFVGKPKQNVQVEPNFIDYDTSTAKNAKEVMLTEALYGMPNSLILVFSEVVKLVKLKFHVESNNAPEDKVKFKILCDAFERKLMEWKSEWKLQDDNGEFFTGLHEGLYHNTISFYNGIIIYFSTMIHETDVSYLQKYCVSTIEHLEKLQYLYEVRKIPILPLFWQGFIAGCSSIDTNVHMRFREWAQKLASGGVGSYWGARQIMFEVWRRRKTGDANDDWLTVHKDWEMNIMLA